MNDGVAEVLRRLDNVEAALTRLLDEHQEREWYGVNEFARIVGKSTFTVREWCRLGRLHGRKKRTGRGKHFEWTISHDELMRYRREGLLPPAAATAGRRPHRDER